MEEKNLQKYENYKEQSKRLNRAINNEFYLEALFIEFAIIEDRAESILRYENNQINSDRFVSIDRKLKKIEKIAEQKKSLPNKYFSDGIIQEIFAFKEERNRMIHALMKQKLTTDELHDLAIQGKQLSNALCKKSTNYKRAVERRKSKEKNDERY